MTILNAITEAQNLTGGATCLGRGSALAKRHPNNIPGRFALLPDRDSAVLPRATSRECCARSRLSGLYHLNAIQNVCGQASTDLFRVRVHLIRLSCSASSSAERKARKAFHDGEKASHDRDFSHHESGQFSQERSHV